jgi:hypothetical protein
MLKICFHGSSCGSLLLYGDVLGAQITVSVVIPPVVRRVNITGNRIRVVAPQVLFGSIRARRGRDEVLVPGGRGPRAGRIWKTRDPPGPDAWVFRVGTLRRSSV